jgi:hypothetical protein
MPADSEVPWAKPVPAKPQFTRTFIDDHELLQREQKPDVPTWLKTVAPLVVFAISLGFLGLLAWGLGRVGRVTAGTDAPTPERRPKPRRPIRTTVPTGARS